MQSMKRASLSPYRSMWLFVMFDLPVLTKPQRKAAARFRADLLDRGFRMSQYSVYLRHCASPEIVEAEVGAVRQCLPSAGRVHMLPITDKQYERMSTFHGTAAAAKRKKPQQFEMF